LGIRENDSRKKGAQIMWAIDWDEMGCTQYAATLEDAHKIGQRGGPFYIITYLGERKCPQEPMQED
jgi:hypothetical protein